MFATDWLVRACLKGTTVRLARVAAIHLAAVAGVCAEARTALAETVSIAYDATNPQARYAARQLQLALVQKRYRLVPERHAHAFRVSLLVRRQKLGSEAYEIAPSRHSVVIAAGDGRGLIYGAFDVVDQLGNGRSLRTVQSVHAAPVLHFRAIKFDLPWDSYRASKALDQHYRVVRDARFWSAFFDMMARNRFNAITLSTLHPWPYMTRTKGFPEANPFTDQQMAQWRQLHRTIFRLAKERGIDTYLLPFNIFVSKEFVAAHGVGRLNTYPRYNTTGDTSPIIKAYVRQSVAQVLAEYPDLTGIGISLGEGMGGMNTIERLDWVRDTYLDAIRHAQRPVKLLWNLPSVNTKEWIRSAPDPNGDERLLRHEIESIGYADGPIHVGLKFNWSHSLSTTTLVQIHGGKVSDTYFSPPPKNYRIDWIARNEDVFALRWGVPSFVRRHILTNGKASYVDGYTVGSETYIPALDYFTAKTPHSQWTYAFERQWLFYMLWGRLLYDPATPDNVFADAFVRRYGAQGRNLLRGYELASATALRLGSLFYSQWDHTLYSEGMLWLKGRSMAYIGVDDLIKQPVLDPAYVNVADYVAKSRAGETWPSSRMTPPRLADRLEADCNEALKLVAGVRPGNDLALTYEVADIRTWAHLGLHLAAEIRGAVALQTYRETGRKSDKAQAVADLRTALSEWDAVVALTRPLYKNMLLTHFTGQSSALNPDAEFHWKLVRPQVAKDLEEVMSEGSPIRSTGDVVTGPAHQGVRLKDAHPG